MRQFRRDRIEQWSGFVEERETIKFHDRPAISHRNTFASTRSHANPGNSPGNSASSWLLTQSAHANHGVILSSPNTAHTIAQPEHALRRRIPRVRTFINHDPHRDSLLTRRSHPLGQRQSRSGAAAWEDRRGQPCEVRLRPLGWVPKSFRKSAGFLPVFASMLSRYA